jgi:hypothetical protein
VVDFSTSGLDRGAYWVYKEWMDLGNISQQRRFGVQSQPLSDDVTQWHIGLSTWVNA